MVKKSDILSHWRSCMTVLGLFLLAVCLLIVPDSCKHKAKYGVQPRQEELDKPKKAEFVEDLELADFSFSDISGVFIGEINDQPYALCIETADRSKVTGKYYRIDTLESSVPPVPFKLLRERDGHRLVVGSASDLVTFSISADSSAILGTLTTQGEQSKTFRISFKHYAPPVYREIKSTRYREPKYNFTKTPDIQYGTAKGFWTSYPMEDDTNYTRMILKLLPKTAATKKLDLFLDLYVPADSMQKHPLLVLLHGGAFFFGDKGNRNMRVWCEHFAKSGYVVASVNYRLGFSISKSSIQQCGYQAIQDAHAALRYLVANAEEYRIDPDYIFLAGTSAGSITALGTAFMDNTNCPPFVAKNKLPKKCGSLHTSGNEYRDKVKIKAIANMWGAVYDLHELDGRRIPVVSFHGTSDKVVPFDHGFPFSGVKSKLGERLFDEVFGSKAIHHYLDSMHVRNKLYPLDGCGHAPYQEKNGTLNHHYYFIQDKIQEFFYPELKSKIGLKHDDREPQIYCINDDEASRISWQAEGGLILNISGNSVRVLWLEDAPKHLLRASGLNALGVPFKQEWNLQKVCS